MKLAPIWVGVLAMGVVGCGAAPVVVHPAGSPVSDGSPPSSPPPDDGTAPYPDPPAHPASTMHAPNPIVLVHGFSGWKQLAGLDYFYGVAAALRADGRTVYVPQLDPFNSSEVRGDELVRFLQGISKTSGAPKLDLICHSQGGLDCRYAARIMPGQIAAVVTISTPHRGTPLADIVEHKLPGVVGDAADALLDLLGTVLDPQGTMAPDARAAIAQLSSDGAAAFNARYPNDPGVAYFSIAGRSGKLGGDYACDSPAEAPFLARWDGDVDPPNPLLAPEVALIEAAFAVPLTNDGIVPVASARWGTFLGCIPADHFDEVCQIKGASPGEGNPFDCLLFYRQLASWLAKEGY